MGKTEIRTVGKVSFDIPPSEQAVLHVRLCFHFLGVVSTVLTYCTDRIAGILIVCITQM
jgi:hypothetical protein